MEYGLGLKCIFSNMTKGKSLNPCSNGIDLDQNTSEDLD